VRAFAARFVSLIIVIVVRPAALEARDRTGSNLCRMQMIAEVTGLLGLLGGQSAPQIGARFERWAEGAFGSY